MNERTKKSRQRRLDKTKACVAALRDCGYSVNEIAEALDVSRNTVTLFSTGRQCPRKEVFRRLNKITSVAVKERIGTLQTFLGGEQ